MRKSLLIIMSVAILGGLGLYINKKQPISTNVPTTSVQSESINPTATTPSATPVTTAATYKDGTYTGSNANTIYGTVRVAAVIRGGQITDIQFLQMPNDQENSKVVTAMAEAGLKSSALSKQSAHIDFVSGATQTSEGFEQSLQAALNRAAS